MSALLHERPLASILLITYNQQQTIVAAVESALAQDYTPLEIVLSDDASSDATFSLMCERIARYEGPHRVILHRNERNLGIGGNLSRAASLCRGELLLVAAGDDVSLPQRCTRVVQAWLDSGRRADLIASPLQDIDEHGSIHATIMPSDLGRYASAADWVAERPHVIGAAQAWTRRLLERFGPLPEGVVAEDLIMVFRAIVSGGALSLPEPLVQYRRGGISRRVRALSADDVASRLLKNNRHALIELPLLLEDARKAGVLDVVEPAIAPQLARERYIRDVFAAPGVRQALRCFSRAHEVPLSMRVRLLVYAVWPGLLAPWFWLKRRVSRDVA
jgi:glycosyltransferase involved in cell wall biosynthesis